MAQVGFVEGDVTQRTSSVVVLEFWTDHQPDGDGSLRAVDWVRWARVGSNGATTDEKVDRVKKHDPAVWSAIQRAYEAWKNGQDVPVDGTPLEAWPGVSRGQVATLRLLNVRTVEELAEVNDATMDRIGLGSRKLRDAAVAFVAARADGSAAVAAKLAAAEEKNRQLEERLAELEARFARKRKDPGDGAAPVSS